MSVICKKCGKKTPVWMGMAPDVLCLVCIPHWTTEPPTEPGYYRAIWGKGGKPTVMFVDTLPFSNDLVARAISFRRSFEPKGIWKWWSEPIEFEEVPE